MADGERGEGAAAERRELAAERDVGGREEGAGRADGRADADDLREDAARRRERSPRPDVDAASAEDLGRAPGGE